MTKLLNFKQNFDQIEQK